MQNVEFLLADGSALIKRLRRLGPFRWVPQNWIYQIVLAALTAWAPLLLFTAHNGLALGNKVQIPFLADLIQHARFLVALPCAIALGKFVNPRLRNVLNRLTRGGIVTSKDFTRFENAILRARALTSSVMVELVILALVYLYTSFGLHRAVLARRTGGIWAHQHALHPTEPGAHRGVYYGKNGIRGFPGPGSRLRKRLRPRQQSSDARRSR